MIGTKDSERRVIRAVGSFLMIVGVATGLQLDSSSSSSSSSSPSSFLSTTIANTVDTTITSVANEKPEARWVDEDTVTSKPVRSVGWKEGKDSYLEALRHSRTSTDPREGVVAIDGNGGKTGGSFQRRKEYVQGPVYTGKRTEVGTRVGSVDRDSFSILPSDSYTLPSRTATDFTGVRNTYGPPQTPKPSYGPAFNEYYSSGNEQEGNSYLPPQQAYGPPSTGYGPNVPYGHPTSEIIHTLGLPSIDLSWPFALKLNAFTLAKILLKLVIFKMIVKFIAVICLLLFIPKLEIKKSHKPSNDDEEEDEGRGILDENSSVWNRLNVLTLTVHEALDRYGHSTSSNSSDDCSSFGCRVGRATNNDRIWPDNEQLLTSYLLEETRFSRR